MHLRGELLPKVCQPLVQPLISLPHGGCEVYEVDTFVLVKILGR